MSLEELQAMLDEHRTSDPRRAAEIAYVLARRCQDDGDGERANRIAAESIFLFGLCPADTLEDCAASYSVLAGIALPSIIHVDVVRSRFPNA